MVVRQESTANIHSWTSQQFLYLFLLHPNQRVLAHEVMNHFEPFVSVLCLLPSRRIKMDVAIRAVPKVTYGKDADAGSYTDTNNFPVLLHISQRLIGLFVAIFESQLIRSYTVTCMPGVHESVSLLTLCGSSPRCGRTQKSKINCIRSDRHQCHPLDTAHP